VSGTCWFCGISFQLNTELESEAPLELIEIGGAIFSGSAIDATVHTLVTDIAANVLNTILVFEFKKLSDIFFKYIFVTPILFLYSNIFTLITI
jgi:hypothetical protein